MRWIEASVNIGPEGEDALCEALAELGVGGMVVEDERDFRGFLENNRQYWDYVDEELLASYRGLSRVKFYLADDADGRARLAAIETALAREAATAVVDDADWENNWRQYYKPVDIGERLCVCPQWIGHDAGGRVKLLLDPGLLFGTGTHATTRMCLEALEGCARPGGSALDLGCGSGILGIAALLLGCERAAGCDIDPKAPDVVAENAALNGIERERLPIYAGDILSDAGLRRELGGGYDIVLANIVADVIIALAPLVKSFLAPGGAFICSGIIDGREAEAEQAIKKAGLSITGHRHEDGWHCFSAAY